MTERRDSDKTELEGEGLDAGDLAGYELSGNDRSKMFGFSPFDVEEARDLALYLKGLGAQEAVDVKSDDGEVHLVSGRCPEGVRVEVYRGIHAESVDFILHAKIDSFDEGEDITRKLKRMMRRREILEKNGYHLRSEKGFVNDSKPGFNEDRNYRIAYTKPVDTRVKARVSAELKNIMSALFVDFEKCADAEAKDPESDIW